jgi:PhnB protein
LAAGRRVEWCDVALDCGYYDLSHLAREFRAFSGLTPSEHRPVDPGRPNHVALAEEVLRLSEPGGRIGHAEIKNGSMVLMLVDEYPEHALWGPQSLGGTSVAIHLRVDDVDALMEKAKAAGATVVRELQDQFYGERSGSIRDPFGHEWLLGQSIETV